MSGVHDARVLCVVQSNVNRQNIRHCIPASELKKYSMFWNVEKQTVGHTGPVYDTATSTRGTIFATGSKNMPVPLWNDITCVCPKTFRDARTNLGRIKSNDESR